VTRFRLTIEYDGRPFMGWQRQAHGPSVQQAIEEAIGAITHEAVTLHAAGRTDAGVHALAMTAHVDVAKPIGALRLADGINAKLRPLPVAILSAEEADSDFHARFSCIGRRYLYRIANRRAPLARSRCRTARGERRTRPTASRASPATASPATAARSAPRSSPRRPSSPRCSGRARCTATR